MFQFHICISLCFILLQSPVLQCYYWNTEQVGQWLSDIGLAHLVNLFMQNAIDGKALFLVDSARTKVSQLEWLALLRYFSCTEMIYARLLLRVELGLLRWRYSFTLATLCLTLLTSVIPCSLMAASYACFSLRNPS